MERDLIIKALECCKSDDMTHCRECPYQTGRIYCMCKMSADALSLIKELTEENEKLAKLTDVFIGSYKNHIKRIEEGLERLKGEK